MPRELLFRVDRRSLDITHIRGSGPGGQHRNKSHTGVRMKHPPSGVVVEATEERSQEANERAAFRRLISRPAFRKWLRLTAAEAMGMPSIEDLVTSSMAEENIRTQVLDERGAWVDVEVDELW